MKGRPAWSPAGSVLFLTWLLFGTYYLSRFNFSAVIPLLKADLGISNAQAGGLMAFFFVTYTVFQLPAGYLGDRLGPRKVLTFGALVSIIGNLIFSQVIPYLSLINPINRYMFVCRIRSAEGFQRSLPILSSLHMRNDL